MKTVRTISVKRLKTYIENKKNNLILLKILL